MKIYIILSLTVVLLLAFFPMICFTDISSNSEETANISQTADTTADKADNKEETITVLRASSGKTEQVDMTEYLIGAVANEMPASFHIEALKAQAVACYTYALWILNNADNPGEEIPDISDNSGKHQGYLNKEEMKKKWGDSFDKYYERISSAVNEVKNECIMYEDEPILAVYHALSSGTTNSSKDVWGEDISYLQSVTAPGDKLSAQLDSTVTLTEEQIKEALDINSKNDKLTTGFKATASGYVTKVTFGDDSYSGREIRRLLGLKSPNFTLEQSKDKYIFSVRGKGHGVGMSQYSADFMARQGSSYKEILLHFYKGTKIKKSV